MNGRGLPVAMNTFTPCLRMRLTASTADVGMRCVLNDTRVPSMSKKTAFNMRLEVEGGEVLG